MYIKKVVRGAPWTDDEIRQAVSHEGPFSEGVGQHNVSASVVMRSTYRAWKRNPNSVHGYKDRFSKLFDKPVVSSPSVGETGDELEKLDQMFRLLQEQIGKVIVFEVERRVKMEIIEVKRVYEEKIQSLQKSMLEDKQSHISEIVRKAWKTMF